MPSTALIDNDDWRAHYPFVSREIRLDGWRYHYVDEGEGEPLLFSHGNPTWSFYWRELIVALRGRYRVIAVDHLGCGQSDKPQKYPYRLAQHIDNLRELVDRLDLQRVTLLGHDWGGAIGLGAAVEEPSRFSRFVMFNTAAFRSRRIPWRIRVCRAPILGALAVRGLNLFSIAALTMATAKPERMTAGARRGLVAPYDSWANRIAVHRFIQDIPLSPRDRSYQTLESIETRLTTLADRPWMFVWGMRDWCFTPSFLERFLEFIPHAEAHRIADAGHYVVEDAHERIVPLLETFLAAHPLEPSLERST